MPQCKEPGAKVLQSALFYLFVGSVVQERVKRLSLTVSWPYLHRSTINNWGYARSGLCLGQSAPEIRFIKEKKTLVFLIGTERADSYL